MSNEYKDWERDKIEMENTIVKRFPFLRVRDIDGNADMNAKFPMTGLEIPNGWHSLFFQMCDDIKPILEEKGLLNDFYFIQVKEKYNTLRCYASQSVQEVDEILQKYEAMAKYICTVCGKPAEYETKGYIASFCKDCWENRVRHEKCERIRFAPSFHLMGRINGQSYKKTISFKDEWDRYIGGNDCDKS